MEVVFPHIKTFGLQDETIASAQKDKSRSSGSSHDLLYISKKLAEKNFAVAFGILLALTHFN